MKRVKKASAGAEEKVREKKDEVTRLKRWIAELEEEKTMS